MNYFTGKEIMCKSGCGKSQTAPGFLNHLNKLRETVGHALTVNSMCRCKQYNKEVGGKPNSFHICDDEVMTGVDGCCAVDISTVGWDSQKKWKFINAAMQDEWSVGINWEKNFIHIDGRAWYEDSSWPDPVFFKY